VPRKGSEEPSFGYLVRDTSRLMLRLLQEKIEPHGITLSQNFVLRELWENDGLTMSELAARLDVVDPSVANTVDGLVERGLVMRVRNGEDRRRVHARLTEKGKKLRVRLLRYAAEANEAALAGLSGEEIAAARTALRRAKENLLQLRRSEIA
jgi:DNA-binding MarR family transcriptional regulator